MKRRELLGLGGVAVGAMTAGCGFAYDGGAVRETASVPAPGDRETMFVRDGSQFVTGRSGMQWVRDDTDDLTFTVATSVTGVSRGGVTLWRHTIAGSSAAIAYGDAAFLLQQPDDDDPSIVAIDPTAESSDRGAQNLAEAPIAWRETLSDGVPPLGAAGETVYVTTGSSITCLSNGTVDWTESLPTWPMDLHALPDGVLVRLDGELRMHDRTGELVWNDETDGVPEIDIGEAVLAVREHETIELRSIEDGERHWHEQIDPGGGPPVLGAGTVTVPTGSGIEHRDRTDGQLHWEIATGHRPRPALVPDDNTVYVATGDGSVLSVQGGSINWERAIENADDPLAGWIDGEYVAFFDSEGTIRWFQREDEPIPLFF